MIISTPQNNPIKRMKGNSEKNRSGAIRMDPQCSDLINKIKC